ncbi:MAG TPA: integrase [Candidatus Dormibacteraeota bacterium]|nr:integrase [Candidatus Dormibacteraeota bacterium]
MSSISRKEYLKEVKRLYKKAKTKKDKSELITNAVEITGLHRKSLIRLMHKKSPGVKLPETRGRKAFYGSDFHEALVVCWHAMNDICAERLQPFLPDLVVKLQACGELKINKVTRQLLCSVSISTVRRHLQRVKRRSAVPLGTTKPGNLLKKQIAVRYGRWEEENPGWLESDTVAHGGDSAAGQFIHSYDFIDIATAWNEQVASMGMGERATVSGFDEVRGRFPFQILGIDSDNGAEYINNHLYRYCKREHITFTRSRSYKKNDNAHVEQKNWEAIRKMVGYARLDSEEQLVILNELYRGPLRLYLNYFQPTRKRKVKLIDTTTGQTKKFYFEAKTPYQRVMEHPKVAQATKDLLQSKYNTLNPVSLLAEIRTLIDRLNKTLR